MSRSNNSQSSSSSSNYNRRPSQHGSSNNQYGGSNHQHGSSNNQHGGSNYQHGSSNSQSTRIPCCPHCSNLNKFSESVLPTDHYLRETPSPDSKVVCPVLLATECRYCTGLGHTVSRCPLAAAENKRRSAEFSNRQQQQAFETEKAKSVPKSSNKFSALDSESDEDSKPVAKNGRSVMATSGSVMAASCTTPGTKRKREEVIQFDFPELCEATIKPVLVQPMNFMDAITKEAVVVEEKTVVNIPPMLVADNPRPKWTGVFNLTKTKWAESDSEDDDDDETESDRQREMEFRKLHAQAQKQVKVFSTVEPDTIDSW
jgi:hypothetical protein